MNIDPFALLKVATTDVPTIDVAIRLFDAENKLQEQINYPIDSTDHVTYSMDYQTYCDSTFTDALRAHIAKLDPLANVTIETTCRNIHQIRYDINDLVWVYDFQTSRMGATVTRNLKPCLGILKYSDNEHEETANANLDFPIPTPHYVVLRNKDGTEDWSKAKHLSCVHISPFKEDAIAGYNLLVKYSADKLQEKVDKIRSYKIPD